MNLTTSPTGYQQLMMQEPKMVTVHAIGWIEILIIIAGFIGLYYYYYKIKDDPQQKHYVTKKGNVIDRTKIVLWVARGYTALIIIFYALYYVYLLSTGNFTF